jgi:hypothetical protein
MSASEYTVGIVVDPGFGERVHSLAHRIPVWIVDTPVNRAAAESHWRQQADNNPAHGITTFKVDPAASPEDWCAGVLDTVIEHHGEYSHDPPVSSLEVIGAHASPSLLATLADYGFAKVRSRPDGFRASAA